MSDRSNQPDDTAELLPIPDGGLAQQFPAWLRERPRWATTTVADGEVDASPIDPRDLVSMADFPDWLQAIAIDPASRQQEPTPPDLAATEPDRPGESGEPASAIVASEPPATVDDPVPGVASPETAEAQVAVQVPVSETDPAATATAPTFPGYVMPPAAMRRTADGTRTFDPWLIGLVGAAIGVVVATILFLIIQ